MTLRDPLATVVRAISFKTGNFIISKKLNLPARDYNYEKKTNTKGSFQLQMKIVSLRNGI